MDNEERLKKEFEEYKKNNPEKVEQVKNILRKEKELEIFEDYPFEKNLWILEHGEFKTAIEFFYRKELLELDQHKDEEDYIERLSKRKDVYRLMAQNFKRDKALDFKVSNNFEFAIETFETLHDTIDFYLKQLERNKPKGKSKVNKIANGDVRTVLKWINDILPKINNLLFENSILEQWEQILNLEKLETPIQVKKDITLKDIRYFFDKLKEDDFIIPNYLTALISIEAILFNNQILKYSQLIDAKKDIKNAVPPHQLEIDRIFRK